MQKHMWKRVNRRQIKEHSMTCLGISMAFLGNSHGSSWTFEYFLEIPKRIWEVTKTFRHARCLHGTEGYAMLNKGKAKLGDRAKVCNAYH